MAANRLMLNTFERNVFGMPFGSLYLVFEQKKKKKQKTLQPWDMWRRPSFYKGKSFKIPMLRNARE